MNLSIVSIRTWWEKSSKQQRTLAVLFSIGILATGMLLMISGTPDTQLDSIGSSLYYAGVMVKLVGVLLLIVGGAVVLRRWQSRQGSIFGRQLKVLETTRLSPKQSLHIVQVGERRMLIGATDQVISILTELDVPQPAGQEAASAALVETASFSEVLQTVSHPALEATEVQP